MERNALESTTETVHSLLARFTQASSIMNTNSSSLVAIAEVFCSFEVFLNSVLSPFPLSLLKFQQLFWKWLSFHNRSTWAFPSTSTLSPTSPDSRDFCSDLFPYLRHLPWTRPLSRFRTPSPSDKSLHLAGLTLPSLGITVSLLVQSCPKWQLASPNYPEGSEK